ncbi:hypothetical protein ACHQM5_022217 [Ranunculus cassubicifolius]
MGWVMQFGASFRNADGDFIAVLARGLGVNDNYWAESVAVVEAMEFAVSKGWLNLWVESDSLSTVQVFNSGAKPWKLKGRF